MHAPVSIPARESGYVVMARQAGGAQISAPRWTRVPASAAPAQFADLMESGKAAGDARDPPPP